jgi:hypothetical protein
MVLLEEGQHWHMCLFHAGHQQPVPACLENMTCHRMMLARMLGVSWQFELPLASKVQHLLGFDCWCASPLQVLQQNGFSWLPIPPAAAAWQQRAAWLREAQVQRCGSSNLPDLSPTGLMRQLAGWLAPHLTGVRSKAQLAKLDWLTIFKNMVSTLSVWLSIAMLQL